MKLSVEKIASVCHELIRAYCWAIEDYSKKSWVDAPDWQKDSTRAGVKFIKEYPNVNHQDLHASWLDHKVKNGWVYGEVVNEEDKTHPCIMPYGDLPEEQRLKDELFRSTALTLLKYEGEEEEQQESKI
jgi:RyR domain